MTIGSATVIGLVLMAMVTTAVGVFARRSARSTSDLLVAARAVRPVMNAGAISGEYLSAASFLGIAGLVMKFGYDVLWYPVGYAAGYVLLLVFISGPLRRFGAYTIPDFAEGRFDSPRFRRLAVGLVIVIGMFYTLPQMKAAGLVVGTAAGIPYAAGVGIVTVVVVSTVVAGGMRGITLVQSIQLAVKLFAISIPAFALMAHFGSPSADFHSVAASDIPRLEQDAQVDVSPGTAWTVPAAITVDISQPVAADITETATASAPVRRVLQPPNAAVPAGRVVWETQATVSIRAGNAAPFGQYTPATRSADWLKPFGPLTNASGHPLLFTYSLIVAIICGTIGLPHILVRFYTNPDGRASRRTALWVVGVLSLFYVWPPLYGVLGRLHESQLYAGDLTDAVVLKLPALAQPDWLGTALTTLISAGAFAAFASTLSGLLVSLAGALGHDIYGRWLRPDATQKARTRAFRLAALVAGLVGAVLGLQVANFDISVLVGWAFAIAASSFFPLLVLGIWWRGLTTRGAAVGSAVGGAVATLAIVTTMVGSVWSPLGSFLGDTQWLAVVLAQPALVTVPLAFGIMIGLSRASPETTLRASVKMVQMHVPERLGLRRDYIPD